MRHTMRHTMKPSQCAKKSIYKAWIVCGVKIIRIFCEYKFKVEL